MNRRGFFGRMIGAVVAAKLAPQLAETPTPPSHVLFAGDRADLLAFYQLTANNPHINQRELLRRIEAVTLK